MTLTRRTPLRRQSAKRAAITRQGRGKELVGPWHARFRGAGIEDSVRRAVAFRSEGYCEVRGEGCTGGAENMHHRKRRGQGGPDDVYNLIDCCGSGTTGCHGRIHANPMLSYLDGTLIRGTDPDPSEPYRRVG